MMKGTSMDGLWTAEFGSSAGMFGSGVVVFRDGEIWGGDSTYFYIGSYTVREKSFKATLHTAPFINGAISLFRTVGQNLTLEISGVLVDDRHATGQGRPREIPDAAFSMSLTKRV